MIVARGGYMVIGDGLLARAFGSYIEDRNVLVFASGVSNSAEKASQNFDRERRLLERALSGNDGLFVYFGTCSVYDPFAKESHYVRHKLEMEAAVAANAGEYLIFRLPQVVGTTPNPHTLTNFLRDRIVSGEHFSVWSKASRAIIDVDDVKSLCDHFILANTIRNRAIDLYPPVSVTALDLVRMMERILDVIGSYEVADRGSTPDMHALEVVQAASVCGVRFTPDYPERVLRKYYGRR